MFPQGTNLIAGGNATGARAPHISIDPERVEFNSTNTSRHSSCRTRQETQSTLPETCACDDAPSVRQYICSIPEYPFAGSRTRRIHPANENSASVYLWS